MDIKDFLLARVAEDETEALKGGSHNDIGVFARDNYGCLLVQPARVLAECAAKRTVIELADDVETIDDALMIETMSWKWETSAKILGALAAVYSTHPDYRQEWAL